MTFGRVPAVSVNVLTKVGWLHKNNVSTHRHWEKIEKQS